MGRQRTEIGVDTSLILALALSLGLGLGLGQCAGLIAEAFQALTEGVGFVRTGTGEKCRRVRWRWVLVSKVSLSTTRVFAGPSSCPRWGWVGMWLVRFKVRPRLGTFFYFLLFPYSLSRPAFS